MFSSFEINVFVYILVECDVAELDQSFEKDWSSSLVFFGSIRFFSHLNMCIREKKTPVTVFLQFIMEWDSSRKPGWMLTWKVGRFFSTLQYNLFFITCFTNGKENDWSLDCHSWNSRGGNIPSSPLPPCLRTNKKKTYKQYGTLTDIYKLAFVVDEKFGTFQLINAVVDIFHTYFRI